MGRLSQSLLVLVFVLAAAAAGPGAPRAAIMSTGGPNPNWTEMQKYEWYVGYLANFSAPPAQGSRPTSPRWRSEEHTSELQSLMRLSYAAFCFKKRHSTTDAQSR